MGGCGGCLCLRNACGANDVAAIPVPDPFDAFDAALTWVEQEANTGAPRLKRLRAIYVALGYVIYQPAGTFTFDHAASCSNCATLVTGFFLGRADAHDLALTNLFGRPAAQHAQGTGQLTAAVLQNDPHDLVNAMAALPRGVASFFNGNHNFTVVWRANVFRVYQAWAPPVGYAVVQLTDANGVLQGTHNHQLNAAGLRTFLDEVRQRQNRANNFGPNADAGAAVFHYAYRAYAVNRPCPSPAALAMTLVGLP